MTNKTSVIPYEEYVIVDVETTGFSPENCGILQIAASRIRMGEESGNFVTFVDPERPIPPSITELTGITDEDVKGAPHAGEAVSKFLEFAGGLPLAGHNVMFDFRFLNYNACTFLEKRMNNACVDTLQLARELVRDCANYKLATLTEYFQISSEGHHRADQDVRMTYELIIALSRLNEEYRKKNGGTGVGCPPGIYSGGRKSRHSYQNHVSAREISAKTADFDEKHPLFGKGVVFTGTLCRYDRRTAMQYVADAGGRCQDSVTKSTDYLVLGDNSFNRAVKDGKSSKVKKAREMIEKGSGIQILPESAFYELLQYEPGEPAGPYKTTEPGGRCEPDEANGLYKPDEANGQYEPGERDEPGVIAAGEQAAWESTPDLLDLNERINKICGEVIGEMGLPDQGVFLQSYVSRRGERAGNETSRSICISEPEYPAAPSAAKKRPPNKSAVVMNIPSEGESGIELVIRKTQFEAIKLPDSAAVKETKDEAFSHVLFPADSPELFSYIKENMIYCVEHYQSNVSFGCCSRFLECSDQRACVHENKLYARGCSYGKNLKQGRIFYGKNKTV